MNPIHPGVSGEKMITATPELTATHMKSGDVEVFATPAMIALMEGAAVAAIQGKLPAGQTSVGIMVNVQHIAASPVGAEIRAKAEVIAVEGKEITFRVEAWHNLELIGQGTHRRAMVDVERFMKRVNEKGR